MDMSENKEDEKYQKLGEGIQVDEALGENCYIGGFSSVICVIFHN